MRFLRESERKSKMNPERPPPPQTVNVLNTRFAKRVVVKGSPDLKLAFLLRNVIICPHFFDLSYDFFSGQDSIEQNTNTYSL